MYTKMDAEKVPPLADCTFRQLLDAEAAIAAFLQPYRRLFPEEIRLFLQDLQIAVADARSAMDSAD